MTVRERILAILRNEPALHFSQHIGLADALEAMVEGEVAKAQKDNAGLLQTNNVIKADMVRADLALAEAKESQRRMMTKGTNAIADLTVRLHNAESYLSIKKRESSSLRARIAELEGILTSVIPAYNSALRDSDVQVSPMTNVIFWRQARSALASTESGE